MFREILLDFGQRHINDGCVLEAIYRRGQVTSNLKCPTLIHHLLPYNLLREVLGYSDWEPFKDFLLFARNLALLQRKLIPRT